MKKFLLFSVCLFTGLALGAAQLPDNMYFRAMKDEMDRSLAKLRVKGSPKPYYVAYQLTEGHAYCASASLGALHTDSQMPATDSLSALAVVATGTPQNDSMGFKDASSEYAPVHAYSVPKSYWGIRHQLWDITNEGFNAASEVYEKKQTYKRQKHITEERTDFARAPQASFVEPIVPFPAAPTEQMEEWVKTLSAQGKEVPYMEDFSVRICLQQQDLYYLNSDGGHYQYTLPASWVQVQAKFRNQQGYEETLTDRQPLPADFTLDPAALQEQTRRVLRRAEQIFTAKKGEPYLGPVLLMPQPAAVFIKQHLVKNVSNLTPLLPDPDVTAGSLRNKTDLRVMSNSVEVYDKPQLRQYKGLPLAGFAPVDDEGVLAQDLTLVASGKFKQLPQSRRSNGKGQKSNGHARMSFFTLPREALTNVFVKAKNPLSQEALEEKLLQRCRELELDYCYVVWDVSSGLTDVNLAERLYTKDGRREAVFGMKTDELGPRALRDILAAGQEEAVVPTRDVGWRNISLITPALLVDEVELIPTEKQPDRKPFVSKP